MKNEKLVVSSARRKRTFDCNLGDYGDRIIELLQIFQEMNDRNVRLFFAAANSKFVTVIGYYRIRIAQIRLITRCPNASAIA